MNANPLASQLSKAEHDAVVAAYDDAATGTHARRSKSIGSLLRAANAIKAGRDGVNDFALPGCSGITGLELLAKAGFNR